METLQKKSLFTVQCSQLGRLTIFVFRSIFRTVRTYVYNLIIPAITFALLFMIETSFGSRQINYFERTWVLALFLIGPLFTLIGASAIILNWRESVLIKEMKVMDIKKSNIVISLWLGTFALVISSYLFMILTGLLLDTFLVNKNVIISLKLIKSAQQVFAIIYALILCSLISFGVAYLVSFRLNSPILIQTINLLIIGYTIATCNFIDPNKINNYSAGLALDVLGYLDPFKTIQWMLVPGYVNVFSKSSNLIFAIWNIHTPVPFASDYRFGLGAFWLANLTSFCWTVIIFIPIAFIRINKI